MAIGPLCAVRSPNVDRNCYGPLLTVWHSEALTTPIIHRTRIGGGLGRTRSSEILLMHLSDAIRDQ